MPQVSFEPTIPASERAKRVHALDHAAIVTSFVAQLAIQILYYTSVCQFGKCFCWLWLIQHIIQLCEIWDSIFPWSISLRFQWCVQPLPCNDREMGGYTTPVSKQRLSKHVPIPRQQILNNATVGLQQWKRGVSAWSVLRCYKQGTKSKS
jgi:hypothetical protein